MALPVEAEEEWGELAPALSRPVCVAYVSEAAAALLRSPALGGCVASLSRPELWSEAELLERLLHKCHNQHRGSRHHARLLQLRRCVRLLHGLQLGSLASGLVACAPRAGGASAALCVLPSAAHGAHACRRLLAAARLCCAARRAAGGASRECSALVGASFFMPLALVASALCARLAQLCAQLASDCCAVHNAVAPALAWLPAPVGPDAGAPCAALLSLDWAAHNAAGAVLCHGRAAAPGCAAGAVQDEGTEVARPAGGGGGLLTWEQRRVSDEPEPPVAHGSAVVLLAQGQRPRYSLARPVHDAHAGAAAGGGAAPRRGAKRARGPAPVPALVPPPASALALLLAGTGFDEGM